MKTKVKEVEIRKDFLFGTAPASESQQLGPSRRDNLKSNEHKTGEVLYKVPPGLSHHAFSSVLGGGTRENSEIKKARNKVQLKDTRSPVSDGRMRFASFSSSFSPGFVDTMPSRRMRDNAAFLTGSIMRTSAL